MTKVTLAQDFFRQPARERFTLVMRGDFRQHVALQFIERFSTDQYSFSIDNRAGHQSLFGCGFDHFVAPARARGHIRAVQAMSFRARSKLRKLLRAIGFPQIIQSPADLRKVSGPMLRRERIEDHSATKRKLRRV